ncbi:zinc finger protein 135-like isoform X2 [Notolabrus celidotus]|uniref:zinc finger protein 135-like isoform X2 n=1 Tax=Notolabrus celidotus TaxID=1203425 RepID=UPI0014907FBF|nr:zinc finger protein 135-like isoform X2 [Notolabrus celidotus]
MSKIQTLRGLVNQRLTAAAEEIFELFERTIAEYEDQIRGTKEKQHKLLNSVYNPEVLLQRAGVHQLLEEVPSQQQERSSSLDQEDAPEPPHIKEEEEELWSSQEGAQLQGLEEEDFSAVTFNPVSVKSEEGDVPQSSESHQTYTEERRDTERDPGRYLQPDTPAKTLNSVWEESSEAQSGFISLQNNEVPVSECNMGGTSVSPFVYAMSFGLKDQLQNHQGIPAEEKPFSCSVCGKGFSNKKYLQKHTIRHSEERRFSCSLCEKTFLWRVELVRHTRTHTREKPFTCHICGMVFVASSRLAYHLKHHTAESQFTCSVCDSSFSHKESWIRHMRSHTGEKPFTCLFCGKTFSERGNLNKHLRVHTGEKPFSCSVCEKQFSWSSSFKNHRCCGQSNQGT